MLFKGLAEDNDVIQIDQPHFLKRFMKFSLIMVTKMDGALFKPKLHETALKKTHSVSKRSL